MKRFIISLAALFLCMCMPMKTSTSYRSVHHKKPLYAMDGYQKPYSHYLERPNEKTTDELMAALKKSIEKPAGVLGVVPPGMYADYAVLMISKEEHLAVQKLAEHEIALYPEAETYINRILKTQEK